MEIFKIFIVLYSIVIARFSCALYQSSKLMTAFRNPYLIKYPATNPRNRCHRHLCITSRSYSFIFIFIFIFLFSFYVLSLYFLFLLLSFDRGLKFACAFPFYLSWHTYPKERQRALKNKSPKRSHSSPTMKNFGIPLEMSLKSGQNTHPGHVHQPKQY